VAVVKAAKGLGLEPSEEPEVLLAIRPEVVHPVCWLAIASTKRRAELVQEEAAIRAECSVCGEQVTGRRKLYCSTLHRNRGVDLPLSV